jgi:hypothetical protein
MQQSKPNKCPTESGLLSEVAMMWQIKTRFSAETSAAIEMKQLTTKSAAIWLPKRFGLSENTNFITPRPLVKYKAQAILTASSKPR